MALLYVTEFQKLPFIAPVDIAQAVQQPPVADQPPVAIGGSSLQSAAFNSATTLVRVHADSVCSIAFGPNPTATTANARMAAGQTEYFGVTPGMKVAVIANT